MQNNNFLKQKWPYLLLLIAMLLFPLVVSSRYYIQIMITASIWAMATLSLNLILGYTGQASLAHAGFFGIGAYTVALTTTKIGLSFWLALPLAGAIAALVGLFIGILTLRTQGHYFAISTLCFGVIVYIVAGSWIELTKGATGLLGIPKPTLMALPFIGKLSFANQTAQYYLVLFFLLLFLFIMYRLVHSLQGLSFMAIRNNESLAEAVGINTFNNKLLSFIIANFLVGVAGGIYAVLMGGVSPTVASFNLTFFWLAYLIIGGVATLAGPIVGAFLVTFLMEYMYSMGEYRLVIFGLVLIVAITFFPRGLVGLALTLRQKLRDNKGHKGVGLNLILRQKLNDDNGQRGEGAGDNATESRKINETV